MDDARQTPLSDEEWRYVSNIRMTVGCITPALNGLPQDNAKDIKRYLTKAKAAGLDPERIYRVVVSPNSPMTGRLPPWDKVKPTEA